MLFAISSFSGKLLTLFIQPFITYAMREGEEGGITKLPSQCANLLIPLVGLGISYAVLRFGLDKNYSRRQVYTCGLAAVFGGFILMLLFYPLLKLVPIFTDYAVYLYIYVLMSCLRTLTSQLVRCRQLNRLVAVDGILCSAATLLYNVIFLLGFDLGAKGYLLAIICGDATSTVFMFIVGNVAHYVDFSRFNKKLLVQMLRYSIPLIPAQISFWVINASDLFFVKGLLGESGNYWSGLLGTGYFLPTILVTLGTIFYEAWQLSAVTEQKGREAFFSKVFYIYQCVMFSCAAGIIWLCRPVMHIMKSNYYTAWHFVPFLALASTCSCFNQFLNSVYVVNKKSTHSLWTMLAGAVSNCIMNYFFIKWWGPVGATYASFLGLGVVFTLRAIDAHNMIGMSIHPARVLLNFAVLAGEALVLLAEVPLYGLWTGLITLGIILYNFAGVWMMARLLLPKLFGRRGKAFVNAVDAWAKSKKN